jgi:hypothetical protein
MAPTLSFRVQPPPLLESPSNSARMVSTIRWLRIISFSCTHPAAARRLSRAYLLGTCDLGGHPPHHAIRSRRRLQTSHGRATPAARCRQRPSSDSSHAPKSTGAHGSRLPAKRSKLDNRRKRRSRIHANTLRVERAFLGRLFNSSDGPAELVVSVRQLARASQHAIVRIHSATQVLTGAVNTRSATGRRAHAKQPSRLARAIRILC